MLLEITGTTLIGGDDGVGFDITLGINKTKGKSSTYASLVSSKEEGISLPDLIKSFNGKAADIPDFLNSLPRIKSFDIVYGSGEKSSEFKVSFDSEITINGKKISITVYYFSASKDETSGATKSAGFGGILKVGNHAFGLKFLSHQIGSQTASYMLAHYIHSGSTSIHLKEISQHIFSDEIAEITPEINLELTDFKAFILYSKQQQQQSKVLFGMGAGLGADFNLKNLPMVGEVMEENHSFKIDEVMVMMASEAFSAKELEPLSEYIPPIDIAPYFNISTTISIAQQKQYYSLTGGSKPKEIQPPQSGPSGPITRTDEQPTTPAKPTIKWTNVQKKLGPIELQRIGFSYNKGNLILMLDADMTMSVMQVQLVGLGFGFKVKWPPSLPDVSLNGIGISYKSGPITISGMFVRVPHDDGTLEFYGAALIQTSAFTIGGIGSYAKTKDGTISLFVYGAYSGPLGGPAFFFVTGIALGFGYNRTIKLPSINEVRDFPLVAMVLNPDPKRTINNILSDLIAKNTIPISPGDYWLAIGIKFTSFKIVESFVLLTVNFGTRLEFAIIGLSVLRWPEQKIVEKAKLPGPIVYIELAVLARFGPDSDKIAVDALITPNSYLISKDCRLSGGFAFYTWISGPHEGDFVITLGGYHPKFKKPSHYPTVPRLALNWKVSNALTIRGEMYYALTPTAIMAGGRWEVLFQMSMLSASFTLWADMLISWAPFQYYIDIGICIKISANIKILFIRIHFSIEMTAELHIWGPPFAGEAYVDWKIFSFTIPFGSSKKELPAALTWDAFRSGFIPASPINIKISSGVIKQYEKDKDTLYVIVNPMLLELNIDSFIPTTELKMNGDAIADDTPMKSGLGNMVIENGVEVKNTYQKRNKKLGIRPSALDAGKELAFETEVTITLKTTKVNMRVTCIAKGVTEALWSDQKNNASNQNPGSAQVISNVLSGILLQPPPKKKASQTLALDFSKIYDVYDQSFVWSYKYPRQSKAYHSYDVYETILGVYTKKSAIDSRNNILKSIEKVYGNLFDQDPIEDIRFNNNLQEIKEYFKAPPVLCGIGEIPQFAIDTQ
jgi:hypothetical protein